MPRCASAFDMLVAPLVLNPLLDPCSDLGHCMSTGSSSRAVIYCAGDVQSDIVAQG